MNLNIIRTNSDTTSCFYFSFTTQREAKDRILGGETLPEVKNTKKLQIVEP